MSNVALRIEPVIVTCGSFVPLWLPSTENPAVVVLRRTAKKPPEPETSAWMTVVALELSS
jgi:hypothetical protein